MMRYLSLAAFLLVACGPPAQPVREACTEFNLAIALSYRTEPPFDCARPDPHAVCIWEWWGGTECDPAAVAQCTEAIGLAHDCAALNQALAGYCDPLEVCW